MSSASELLAKVESYTDQMIEAQRALTATPALGPDNEGPGEAAKAALVQSWLEEMGLAIEHVDAPDERAEGGVRPNFTASTEGSDGPAVWMLSHLDVVPVGDLNLWDSDPFTMRVDGDRIYGRGVSDNQQGMVASMFALKAVMDSGISLPGKAGLVLVSDEETGSAYGLEYVLKVRPDLFTPNDLIVVPDGGEPDGDFIEVAEKSMMWLKVEVIGHQVHASMPDKGKNALYGAARMMVAVREMYQRYDQVDPLYLPPGSTFEPTAKEAGVPNVNTIPGRDVFYVDCRVLPNYDLAEVKAAFEDTFGRIAGEEGLEVNIEAVQYLQAPPGTDPQAPIVAALTKAIAKTRGIQAKPCGVGGGTVAAFFRQLGLPVAVWNTWQNTAHQPNEYTLISDMVADAKVFALLFSGLYE